MRSVYLQFFSSFFMRELGELWGTKLMLVTAMCDKFLMREDTPGKPTDSRWGRLKHSPHAMIVDVGGVVKTTRPV